MLKNLNGGLKIKTALLATSMYAKMHSNLASSMYVKMHSKKTHEDANTSLSFLLQTDFN